MKLKRFVLTISATWTFVITYYLRKFAEYEYEMPVKKCFSYLFSHLGILVFLIVGTLVMIISPFVIVRLKKHDHISKVKLVELVDNSYIPTYLGYFFVSMSVSNFTSMIIFYVIIVVFTYKSSIEYFNPLFLFMGYHIYKVESDQGVQNIIILKTKNIIRKSESLNDLNLYRVNNMTYIGQKEGL